MEKKTIIIKGKKKLIHLSKEGITNSSRGRGRLPARHGGVENHWGGLKKKENQ